MLKIIRKNKFIIGIILAGAVLAGFITWIYSVDSSQNAEIVEYIESVGWEIDKRPVEISYLTIPKEFDAIYNNYNTYQKEAGFDLASFKGMRAVRYSYVILNHESSNVRANVIAADGKIIAADISSTVKGGFMHAINNISNMVR